MKLFFLSLSLWAETVFACSLGWLILFSAIHKQQKFWCGKTFSFPLFPVWQILSGYLSSLREGRRIVYLCWQYARLYAKPPAAPHSQSSHNGMSSLLSFLFFLSWKCMCMFFCCNRLPRQHVEAPLWDFCAVLSCDPVDNKHSDRHQWYACCSTGIVITGIRSCFSLRAARMSFINCDIGPKQFICSFHFAFILLITPQMYMLS